LLQTEVLVELAELAEQVEAALPLLVQELVILAVVVQELAVAA
jgi:hypothetical protein